MRSGKIITVMNQNVGLDKSIVQELHDDAKQAKLSGIVLLITGVLSQLFHLIDVQFSGFRYMLLLTGGILIVSGILFILGSFNVPKTRKDLIVKFQKVMIDSNPKRRLWAAQRLIGYAKDANLTKDDILRLAKQASFVVKNPPGKVAYRPYIAVDHLIFLREMAVNVPMNKHIRKQFVQVIKPLQKIKNLPDEGQELLADAIAYHPSKLPVQAYADLEKIKKENSE